MIHLTKDYNQLSDLGETFDDEKHLIENSQVFRFDPDLNGPESRFKKLKTIRKFEKCQQTSIKFNGFF